MRKLSTVLFAIYLSSVLFSVVSLQPATAQTAQHMVYNVYTNLNMGNKGEQTRKDYYVNVGTQQGIKKGDRLKVYRKVASFNLLSKKLYRDMTLPFAELQVLHAEGDSSVARLVQFFPEDETPAVHPRAVMVGDLISRSRQ